MWSKFNKWLPGLIKAFQHFKAMEMELKPENKTIYGFIGGDSLVVETIFAVKTGQTCIGYKHGYATPRFGYSMALVNVEDVHSST